MHANGLSSHFASGTAMTAACAMPGMPAIAFSRSTDEIHSPPDFTRAEPAVVAEVFRGHAAEISLADPFTAQVDVAHRFAVPIHRTAFVIAQLDRHQGQWQGRLPVDFATHAFRFPVAHVMFRPRNSDQWRRLSHTVGLNQLHSEYVSEFINKRGRRPRARG